MLAAEAGHLQQLRVAPGRPLLGFRRQLLLLEGGAAAALRHGSPPVLWHELRLSRRLLWHSTSASCFRLQIS